MYVGVYLPVQELLHIYVLHVCEGQDSLVASTVPTTSNLVVIVATG
jgi:hypothetical protein